MLTECDFEGRSVLALMVHFMLSQSVALDPIRSRCVPLLTRAHRKSFRAAATSSCIVLAFGGGMSRSTNALSLFRFYLPNRAFGRAARRRLQARYPDQASAIWRSTRAWQSRLEPDRPHHSPGVNLNVRYMEWCCALYRAAQEHGVDRAEAAALVEETLEEFYAPVMAALFDLSRLRSAQRETRIRWLFDIMIRSFFTAPFEYRRLPSEPGVAFDVLRCPVSEYFEARGVPELTPHYCKTDYMMAREWGMELNRSQTIATGAEYCDFRFRVARGDA